MQIVSGTSSSENITAQPGDDSVNAGGGDDTIASGSGSDFIDGGDGADKVTYAGPQSGYFGLRSEDGSVALAKPGGSTDVLLGVEAVSFNGGADVSMEALAGGAGTAADDPLIGGTSENNRLYGLQGDDQIVGGGGNDTISGGEGEDLAAYSGSSTTFSFVRNEDGSVEVADATSSEGTDRLSGVEAIWFDGDQTWTSIEDLVGQYGTSSDDPLVGGSENSDRLYGLDGDDDLVGGEGDDTLDGGAGDDQAAYAGSSTQFTWLRMEDGSVQVAATSGTEGTDKLVNIEAVWFDGDQQWRSIENLVGQIGTPEDDAFIGGSDYSDHLFGFEGDDELAGGVGNDTIDGGLGDDLAAYAGSLSDFTFVRNSDGSVTVTDTVGDEGADRLIGIEAVWFDGSSTWKSVDELVV
jgi:Ca2+-binding RTX toxin-like protein